jgi:hypothetical protein
MALNVPPKNIACSIIPAIICFLTVDQLGHLDFSIKAMMEKAIQEKKPRKNSNQKGSLYATVNFAPMNPVLHKNTNWSGISRINHDLAVADFDIVISSSRL